MLAVVDVSFNSYAFCSLSQIPQFTRQFRPQISTIVRPSIFTTFQALHTHPPMKRHQPPEGLGRRRSLQAVYAYQSPLDRNISSQLWKITFFPHNQNQLRANVLDVHKQELIMRWWLLICLDLRNWFQRPWSSPSRIHWQLPMSKLKH